MESAHPAWCLHEIVDADANPNFQPSTYPYEFFDTELTYRYPTYKVLAQDDAALDRLSDEQGATFRLRLARMTDLPLEDVQQLETKSR